jgi:hypothetical protein
MRRYRLVLLLAAVMMGVSLLVLLRFAPATTSVTLVDCVRLADACLQLPTVTGTTLAGETITFPEAFSGALNLVVMPFDRDQQVQAIEFVPVFQELAAEYEQVAYYSIAALPDLAAPIRLLVSGGMQAAVSDPTLRATTALLYLEDQQAFMTALAVPDDSTIQIFIFNPAGEVLFQAIGADPTELAVALREKLTQLTAP